MNTTQKIIDALKEHGLPEIGDGASIVIGPIVAEAIAAAVQAEREANCAAMCKECAAGSKAVQGSSEVWGDRWIHWMIDEGRYIGCSASKIRARKDVTK